MKKSILLLCATVAMTLTSCSLFNSNTIGEPVNGDVPPPPPAGNNQGYNNGNYNHYDYTIDKRYVYYRGVVIRDADPRSFQDLGDGYAKDSRYVYYNGQRLQGVNPQSFTGRSSDRRAGQRTSPPANNNTPPRTRW